MKTRRIFGCLGFLACLLIGLAVAVRFSLVIVTVEGQSMYPTLKHEDRVLALQRWPRRWLRRGQIVLVWPWLPPRMSAADALRTLTPFIKRIVGVEGDTLVTSITDIAEHLRTEQIEAHDANGLRSWQIPAGHVFVRGDNSPGGHDSLTWGPVASRTVLGVIVMRMKREA